MNRKTLLVGLGLLAFIVSRDAETPARSVPPPPVMASVEPVAPFVDDDPISFPIDESAKKADNPPYLPDVMPPAPPPIDDPAPPQYSLADISGRVWQCPDRQRLNEWIAQKNAEIAQARTVAPPRQYQLADATGQVWIGSDPAALSQFVGQRNAASRPLYRFSSACSTGNCPR